MKHYPHYITLAAYVGRTDAIRWFTPLWSQQLQHVYSSNQHPASDLPQLQWEPYPETLLASEPVQADKKGDSISVHVLQRSAVSLAIDILGFRVNRSTSYQDWQSAQNDAFELAGIYRVLFRSGVSSELEFMRVIDRAKCTLQGLKTDDDKDTFWSTYQDLYKRLTAIGA